MAAATTGGQAWVLQSVKRSSVYPRSTHATEPEASRADRRRGCGRSDDAAVTALDGVRAQADAALLSRQALTAAIAQPTASRERSTVCERRLRARPS